MYEKFYKKNNILITFLKLQLVRIDNYFELYMFFIRSETEERFVFKDEIKIIIKRIFFFLM